MGARMSWMDGLVYEHDRVVQSDQLIDSIHGTQKRSQCGNQANSAQHYVTCSSPSVPPPACSHGRTAIKGSVLEREKALF